ncbi:IclR family transcriptional regulator [Sinomonas sp. P47F7]|uniref:IclR family transcriptional regulator n=1 Tax=Sinomonas sp. P47F7 TaxID=3410987 RepID=UPI003BF59F6E
MPTERDDAAPAGGLQVVSRSAQILRMFSSDRTEVRINDVAEELGIGRTSAHRYLQSLAAEGFLQRINDNDYRPGPLIMGIAASMLTGPKIIDLAEPLLATLAERTGQTAVLGLWTGSSAVAVASKEPAGKSVNMTVRIGAPLGPQSAQGLGFLTWGSPTARERILAGLGSERADVERKVNEAAAAGYTTSEAVIEGVAAVAAPVFDAGGSVLATLALVAPVGVLDTAPQGRHVADLKAAATALSTTLGASTAA